MMGAKIQNEEASKRNLLYLCQKDNIQEVVDFISYTTGSCKMMFYITTLCIVIIYIVIITKTDQVEEYVYGSPG